MKSLTKSLVVIFLCSVAVSAYPVSSMLSSFETGLTELFTKSFAAVTDPPLVETYPVTQLADTSAMLNGGANPNGSDSVGRFRYSTTDPGTCNDTFGTQAPGGVGGGWELSGTELVPYSIPIYNLSPGTTYYYCAIAQNAFGTGLGPVRSFTTTGGAPLVGTYPATELTTTSAMLNGGANPTGLDSLGFFMYSTTDPGTCNDTFGMRAPEWGGGWELSGTDVVPYSIAIYNLSPGTTYFYCAIAGNSVGLGFGTVHSFTTLGGAPSVETHPAAELTTTSAMLNGGANPGGVDSVGWFRYSMEDPGTCNDTFGIRAPEWGGGWELYGTDLVPYSIPIFNLSPGTTYYYCAIAGNSVGLGFGTVQSFTTLGSPPIVGPGGVTQLTTTSAMLEGSANPTGVDSIAWFRYSTTSPGTCNDTFGTRAPFFDGTGMELYGTDPVPFLIPIGGLTPGTTYYYCAIAQNSVGTGFGPVESFTTLGTAPIVGTVGVLELTTTSATLEGIANPTGVDSIGWFRYSTTSPGSCNDTFGTRAPFMDGVGWPLFGTDPVNYFISIEQLSPGTTYYYCAIAQNSVGTGFGPVQSFTTLGTAPIVGTVGVLELTTTSATLEGIANPTGVESLGWFRYSTTSPGQCNDTFGTRAPFMDGVGWPLFGTDPVSYFISIEQLSPGTTYYYCAIAQNSVGTGFGPVQSFTTLGTAPIVGTGGVTQLTTTSAMLEGTANPTGVESTGWFRYSTTSPGTCNDTFGTRAPFMDGVGWPLFGTDPVSYFISIEQLSPGTTYYYCAIAQNSVGTGFGPVRSFTTLGSVPTVVTVGVLEPTTTSATLEGIANPTGVDSIGWFRYSTTNPGQCNDTFGTRAPILNGIQLSGTDPVPYLMWIDGLSPATTYYYCAIAQNSLGTGFGNVASFTTLALPTVQFASAAFMDDESQTMQILVTRTGDTSAVSTVNYETSVGSATAGSCGSGADYVAAAGTLQFNAAETEKWFPVTLCSDSLTENVESFGVTLSSPTGVTLGGQSTATANINDTASQFRDSNPIQLFGPTAVPYPAQITVAVGPMGIGSIRVTLYDLVYANPEDIDVLLVGPGGQQIILMADTGGANALNSPTTLTFTDSAGQVLPDASPFGTGAYEPTSWGTQETVFASPAPVPPYNEPGNAVGGTPSLLWVFGTTNSNGTWSLYVRSDAGGGFSELGASSGFAGGWGLEFLAPSVATASLTGRVVDTNGAGLNNATITVEGGGLPAPIKVKSSPSGNYVVNALPTGRTYLITASAKHYTFVPQFVPVYGNITGLDFVGTR